MGALNQVQRLAWKLHEQGSFNITKAIGETGSGENTPEPSKKTTKRKLTPIKVSKKSGVIRKLELEDISSGDSDDSFEEKLETTRCQMKEMRIEK